MHGDVTPTKLTKEDQIITQSEVKSRGLQSVAYSKTSEKSELKSSVAKRLAFEQDKQSEDVRSRHSKSTITQNFERRRDRVQSKPVRKLSPLAEDPEHYECRLLNENENYSSSPAARHAMADGSLNPYATFFNRTFNRKLKMRDTFTKIFPSYTHGSPSVAGPSQTQVQHAYPDRNADGRPTHEINREFTLKKDAMKDYHESILKIANMARGRDRKNK